MPGTRSPRPRPAAPPGLARRGLRSPPRRSGTSLMWVGRGVRAARATSTCPSPSVQQGHAQCAVDGRRGGLGKVLAGVFAAVPAAGLVDERAVEDAAGVRVAGLAGADMGPGGVQLGQGRLGQVLRQMPVTAQQVGRPAQMRLPGLRPRAEVRVQFGAPLSSPMPHAW